MRFLLFIALAIFSFSLSLQAATVNKINVVAETFHPYQYLEDGEPKGIAIEVIKHLFTGNDILTGNDIEADINFYPWPRALRLAKSEPNTLILSISRSKEREQDFHWIGLVDSHELHLWVNAEHWQDKTVSTQALKKLVIGVPRGGHQYQFISNLPQFKNNEFSIVNNKEQVLKMFAMGRVDAISGDKRLLSNRMRQIGLSPKILKPVAQLNKESNGLYIAMSKNSDKKLVNLLTYRLRQFSKTDEFKKLLAW